MHTITVTSVEGDVKRQLKAAAALAGRDVSSIVRAYLPQITAELQGARPSLAEMEAAIAALMVVITAFQLGDLSTADEYMVRILETYPWVQGYATEGLDPSLYG